MVKVQLCNWRLGSRADTGTRTSGEKREESASSEAFEWHRAMQGSYVMLYHFCLKDYCHVYTH